MSAENPFGGLPFFGDIARMVASQGPVAWEPATQLALAIATQGESEPNIDPLERIRIEELARVAEVQITGMTGLSISTGGGLAQIEPVTRSVWVMRTFDAYRPMFERLARQLATDPSTKSGTTRTSKSSEPPVPGLEDLVGLGDELSQFDDQSDAQDEEAEVGSWLTGMLNLLNPMLLGMTAGSLIGHLSRSSFGTYDLPLPRPPGTSIMVLPAVMDAFAEEWSIDADSVRLAICLHELTSHAVISLPHVRSALEGLLAEFAAGFEPDPDALERHLGEIDPSNPESLESFQQVLSDPEIIVGASTGPEQRQRRAQIDSLVAVIVGAIEHVVDTVGSRLIDDYPKVSEALKRRRVSETEADHFTSRLFGIELGQDLVDRGRNFVAGVTERSGEAGLGRLWESADNLPTIAEVDAPGLWLARIELDDQH